MAGWLAALHSPAGPTRLTRLRRVLSEMVLATLPIAENLAMGVMRGDDVPRRHLESGAVFRVAEQSHRARLVCGGHEGVHKVFGHELRGMNAIARFKEPLLHCPPSYLMDFGGCRVHVEAVCPIEERTCVYGSTEVRLSRPTAADEGQNSFHHPHPVVRADDIDASTCMQRVCRRLFLAGHWVERMHRRRFIHGPVDIQVHRSEVDNRLYVLKARRLLPPAEGGGRPGTYLVNRLRPEALTRTVAERRRRSIDRRRSAEAGLSSPKQKSPRSAQLVPVSSDALSPFGAADRHDHDPAALRFAAAVRRKRVPAAVSELCQELAGSFTTLKKALLATCGVRHALHRLGVCCGQLGAVAASPSLASPDAGSPEEMLLGAVRVELLGRTVKTLVRRLLRAVGWREAAGGAVRQLLRAVLHPDEEEPEWSEVIWPALREKFGADVPPFLPKDVDRDALYLLLCRQIGLQFRLQGVELADLDQLPLPDVPMSTPGLVVGLVPRIRTVVVPAAAHEAGEAAALSEHAISFLQHIAQTRSVPTMAPPTTTDLQVADDALRYAMATSGESAPEVRKYQEILRDVAGRAAGRGVSAAARRRHLRRRSFSSRLFRYCTASGEPVDLDPSDTALEPWGLQHGMRLRLTDGVAGLNAPSGAHVLTTVLGTHAGQLWRHDDGDIAARPFLGGDFLSIMDRYAMVWVGFETPQEREAHLSPKAVRRAYRHKGPCGVVRLGASAMHQEFDASQRACGRFGVSAADRVQYTQGEKAGVFATVLGVFTDSSGARLWVHDDTDSFPKPLNGSCYADLMNAYCLRLCAHAEAGLVPQPTAALTLGDKAFVVGHRQLHFKTGYQHSQRILFRRGPYAGEKATVVGFALDDIGEDLWVLRDSTAMLECLKGTGGQRGLVDELHSPQVIGTAQLPLTLAPPPEMFPYFTAPLEEGADPAVEEFDRSTSACHRFGLYHGQRYKITRGVGVGEVGTVIGVRGHAVWGHADDTPGAHRLRPENTVALGVPTRHTTVRGAVASKHWQRVQGTLQVIGTAHTAFGTGGRSNLRPVQGIMERYNDGVKEAEERLIRWKRAMLGEEAKETAVRAEHDATEEEVAHGAFRFMTCIGELLEFTTDYHTCERYGFHFGQVVHFLRTHTRSTVVGVARGELWHIPEGAHAAQPLRGSCYAHLRAALGDIRVEGIADGLSPFLDPLMLPGSLVTRSNYSYARRQADVVHRKLPDGRVIGLDHSRSALSAFSFGHGAVLQRVDGRKQARGQSGPAATTVGPTAVAIGVADGCVWVEFEAPQSPEETLVRVTPKELESWVVVRSEGRPVASKLALREVVGAGSRYDHPEREAALLRPGGWSLDEAITAGTLEPASHVWEWCEVEGTEPGNDANWQVLPDWGLADHHYLTQGRGVAPLLILPNGTGAGGNDTVQLKYREMVIATRTGKTFPVQRRAVYSVVDFAAAAGFSVEDPARPGWAKLLCDKSEEACTRAPPLLDRGRNLTPWGSRTEPVFLEQDLRTAVAPALALVRQAYNEVLWRHAADRPDDLRPLLHRLSSFSSDGVVPVLEWVLLTYGVAVRRGRESRAVYLEQCLALIFGLEKYHGLLVEIPTFADFAALCGALRASVRDNEHAQREEHKSEEERERNVIRGVCVKALATMRLGESGEQQGATDAATKWARTSVEKMLDEMHEHAMTVDCLRCGLLKAVRSGTLAAAQAAEQELLNPSVNMAGAGVTAIVDVLGEILHPDTFLSIEKRERLGSHNPTLRKTLLEKAVRSCAKEKEGGATRRGSGDGERRQSLAAQSVRPVAPATRKDTAVESLREHAHEYTRASGEKKYFATSAAACAPFGYCFGQRVRHGVGDLKGRTAVICGVSEGALWRYEEIPKQQHKMLQEGQIPALPYHKAAPFTGASKADIDRLHQLLVVADDVQVRTHDPFLFMTSAGKVAEFDIDDEYCEKLYGLRHGERYSVPTVFPDGTIPGDLPPGGVVTVVGVYDEAMWWTCDFSGACPFGPTPGSSLVQYFGLTKLYTTTVHAYDPATVLRMQSLPEDSASLSASSGFRSAQTAHYTCVDISEKNVTQFGVRHAEDLLLDLGPHAGDVVTVAGVRRRRLYVTTASAGGLIFPLPGDGPKQTQQLCQPRRIGRLRMPVDDDDEATLPFKVVPVDDAVSHLYLHVREWRYRSTGGVSLFDRRTEALLPWGLKHGDRIRFRRGPLRGKEAVIVGVRAAEHSAVLSWDVGPCGRALPASGCARMEQLTQLCDPVVVGANELTEFTG
eukprot:TRINITY_DN19997_c0_g1_i1.p1 TRINITY_DN19997_c0_g1~~TRINITY_DN19997_c0_g1_i1.p1  ORF type:complete len:2337 (+),score=476.28 TRINITY_DN19997_c0_g1_i1:238-7011(+)